jgi:hypothetical protein
MLVSKTCRAEANENLSGYTLTTKYKMSYETLRWKIDYNKKATTHDMKWLLEQLN